MTPPLQPWRRSSGLIHNAMTVDDSDGHPLRSSPRSQAPAILEDAHIVAGVLAGDARASVALYDRCHEAVERSVLRVLRRRDAEFDDLVQASFEKVLASIHRKQFRGQFSLARWASSIATHATIDVLRARVRDRRRLESTDRTDNVIPLFGGNVERRMEARSEVERVKQVLAKMPKKQVEALLLHDVYGHDLEQVALVLNVSVAAAQSRALRGKRELMRRLGLAERETDVGTKASSKGGGPS